MTGDLHPEPGPGLVAEILPREEVSVLDPTGQHRIFRHRRAGVRFGMNRNGSTVWSVCVSIEGRDYVVPPAWIHDTAGAPLETTRPIATVVQFPAGGRRGGAA